MFSLARLQVNTFFHHKQVFLPHNLQPHIQNRDTTRNVIRE